MYGLVNQAIQGLITENYGSSTWDIVRENAGVSETFFLSNQVYDDSITFNLAIEASKILNMTVDEVLRAFGKYWVLKVGKEKYGSLMRSGGEKLMEFIKNLPNFHSRVMLIYPNITPPEFKSEVISTDKIRLIYYSQRKGLHAFMYGLIEGLGEFYDSNCSIEIESIYEDNISRCSFVITT